MARTYEIREGEGDDGDAAGSLTLTADTLEATLPEDLSVEAAREAADANVIDAAPAPGEGFTGDRPPAEQYVEPSLNDREDALHLWLAHTPYRLLAVDDASAASLAGDDPFRNIPVLPDGLQTLTRGWLIRWAEWVAAGRPAIAKEERLTPTPRHAELDFNPALHPRDPDTGQFVERPFDLPDGAPDFGDFNTKETLEYLDDNGAAVDAVLDPDTEVTVDGVPNSATSLDEVPVGDTRGQNFADADSSEEAREVASARIESAVNTDLSASLQNMNTRQARTLTEAVEELSESGDGLFSSVEEIRDHDINATAQAAYDPAQNALLFRSGSMSGNEAYEGYLAENSGFGTVAHETGHAAHYGDSGDDIFDYYFWPEGTDDDDIEQIEMEVSEYAAESPEEFVAEVFSVIATGGELSERVAEIYEQLNGPQLNA